jgi:hypothetical protein
MTMEMFPADEEHDEAGRERADQRADAEQAHRGEEGGAGGRALEDEAGHRDDDGHGEHERRTHPLRRRGADPQVAHEVGDGDAHGRLVEDHDEGGEEEEADRAAVPGRQTLGLAPGGRGVVLGHGCPWCWQ